MERVRVKELIIAAAPVAVAQACFDVLLDFFDLGKSESWITNVIAGKTLGMTIADVGREFVEGRVSANRTKDIFRHIMIAPAVADITKHSETWTDRFASQQ